MTKKSAAKSPSNSRCMLKKKKESESHIQGESNHGRPGFIRYNPHRAAGIDSQAHKLLGSFSIPDVTCSAGWDQHSRVLANTPFALASCTLCV